MGDREAVRLVADALEQLQLGGRVVEHERVRAAGHEDLLEPLRQRDHRDAALAKPASGSRPAESWPLPPSITIRFGSAAKLAS